MSASSKSQTMVLIALLGLIIMSLSSQCHGALQVGFYKGKCKTVDVEEVVFKVVNAHFLKQRFIIPALIRMQFHDCFVHGCDASILIDGADTEKHSSADSTIRGYEVIEEAKAAVEKTCPGVVSCADVVIIAARVSVFLLGGKWYEVQTGRRDGLVSRAADVNLPSPDLTVSATIEAFAAKGLDVEAMVVLLGGHTVGTTHCGFILDRIYNFKNSGKPDSSINPSFLQLLKKRCPKNSDGSGLIPLNSNTKSINLMDNSFYRQTLAGRGVLLIDQELALDSRTRPIVEKQAKNNTAFLLAFGEAMVKLGAVEVLTGTEGQIRRVCNAFNH